MVRVCKKGNNLWTTDSKCARVWYVLHCTSYIFTARTSSQLRSYTDFHVSYSNRIITSNISFERYDNFNVNYHKWYLRYRLGEFDFGWAVKKIFPGSMNLKQSANLFCKKLLPLLYVSNITFYHLSYIAGNIIASY